MNKVLNRIIEMVLFFNKLFYFLELSISFSLLGARQRYIKESDKIIKNLSSDAKSKDLLKAYSKYLIRN